MTYGFCPDNWQAFEAELDQRKIPAAEIERVELRPVVAETPSPVPDVAGGAGLVDVSVVLRSGRVERWRQRQSPPP
ncbi:MAG TPA: hypothetical protein VGR82_04430 [Methylomirabilota bacterium]|nr:hypothetical protein [Methylomirabilota bacterium]